MTDLASNAGLMPTPAAVEYRYDLYLSVDDGAAQHVRAITQQLQQFDKIWFDDNDLVAGTSGLTERAAAMAASRSIAVVVGPDGLGRLAQEEQRQALRTSIERGVRAFFVLLPGARPEEPAVAQWMGDREAVDLRERFANDALTFEGIVAIVGAVEGVSPKAARELVVERIGEPIRPARAVVVTVKDHDHLDPLDAAEADDAAVLGMLQGTSAAWSIVHRSPVTGSELRQAFTELFDDAGEDETLLFYFSGHGELRDDQNVVLCTKNTDPNALYDDTIVISHLASRVAASPSKHKIVVLDCCRSGASGIDANWGDDAAVFLTSRQWVEASTTSALTAALAAAWNAPQRTTGDLRRALTQVDVRFNEKFDEGIELRVDVEKARPLPAKPSGARLHFEADGSLSVRLAGAESAGPPQLSPQWTSEHSAYVENLIDLVDAVVSLVPADRLPMDTVKRALETLGQDLLSSTLTPQVRSSIAALDALPTLNLEISFDQRWQQCATWERVPWECLTLCKDGERPVSLERVVPGRTTKSSTIVRPPPRRAIVWSSFLDNGSYGDGSQHLFTHLLRQHPWGPGGGPEIAVKEPAQWEELYDASNESGSRERLVTIDGTSVPVRDFDVLVLFAPVTSGDTEPQIWLNNQKNVLRPINASSLVAALSQWTCSYVILETTAGLQPRRADGGTTPSRSFMATTALATRLARGMNASVVAACHSPRFLDVARPSEDNPGADRTFAGAVLAELADPGRSLFEAAAKARRSINDRMILGESLDVGLPIVCRPETPAPTSGSRASGSTQIQPAKQSAR